MSEYKYLLYETLDSGKVVRIMLNRPDSRNAQNRGLLVELNEAFLRAEADDEVRVVILGGTGPMFSSGHDLGTKERNEDLNGPNMHPTRFVNGGRVSVPSDGCSKSGITTSRALCDGETCARSRSARLTGTSTPPA